MEQSRSVNDLLSLSERTVLLTGATGHLGSAMARALAEAGASVIASSRSIDSAVRLAESLQRSGSAKHHAVAIDHMDEYSIDAGFADALRLGGQVDVVINNGHEPLSSDWSSVSGADFNRHLMNATGYFLLARKLRDHAVKRGMPGVVVMVGSMYGLVGSYPDAYEGVAPASPVAYHALKGGVLQMTRHLAVYWARDNVRVNCLSPGPFPSAKAPTEMVQRLIGKSPMKRIGRPDELKGAIVFLASDASSYMTGQNLVIDGGWTAW
jgi:gluconate 5-dehydrogenase